LVVYPEGTRNRNQHKVTEFNSICSARVTDCLAQLLPFKNGAWRFAKETGVEIVPVCIQGSQDGLNHNWIASPASLVLTYAEPFAVTDAAPHEESIARVSNWMASILKS
jgi:1-acyl-sn-glycerol-3-phosphate acyltransferase